MSTLRSNILSSLLAFSLIVLLHFSSTVSLWNCWVMSHVIDSQLREVATQGYVCPIPSGAEYSSYQKVFIIMQLKVSYMKISKMKNHFACMMPIAKYFAVWWKFVSSVKCLRACSVHSVKCPSAFSPSAMCPGGFVKCKRKCMTKNIAFHTRVRIQFRKQMHSCLPRMSTRFGTNPTSLGLK